MYIYEYIYIYIYVYMCIYTYLYSICENNRINSIVDGRDLWRNPTNPTNSTRRGFLNKV